MLNLNAARTEGLEVLALGAHCDDIEIGCGGTMLRLAANAANRITWVVFSSDSERAAEATRSARGFLGEGAGRRLEIQEFRDGFLPWSGAEVKDAFERLKELPRPDLVFTHYRHDLHQDHRLVNELTWNTFRDHLVLEYEIPKWDGDLGQPNTFIGLDGDTCERKISLLTENYPSQAGKPWFNSQVFRSLATLRGMECRSGSGLAEAFYGRKIDLSV
jgi:LmbE family N-acetylglucosaminyl deacetylase